MSLAHALLTSLLERSCSGFELARRFDRSIGHFWHAPHQQIYRELAKLEARRLIDSDGSRGRRRDYRVLPAGRDELARWTIEPQPTRPLRDELLVRMRAAAVLGECDIVPVLAARLAGHRERLASFREIERRDFAGRELTPPAQLQWLILDLGIRSEELWISFCSDAITAVDAERQSF